MNVNMNIRIAPIIPALLVAAIGFSAPTLTSSSRRMYTPDPHSMDIVEDDDGIPRMEVRGFTTPTAARTGYNFADILTNRNVNVSNLKVLLRDGTGDNRELKYADLAKIVGYSGGHGVDNKSVTMNSDNNATLVGFEDATTRNIPFKGNEGLEWGGIVGDEKTVEVEEMSDGEDAKIYLHGADESSNYEKYAYLNASGDLEWIYPEDGKTLQHEKIRGYNKLQLHGWVDGREAVPYSPKGGDPQLQWAQTPADASSSSPYYLAADGTSITWVNNPQKGEKGDPGEPGADGKDGTDGNPGEWITNHVAEIVQLLSGSFVTSVNGETGDVVLKDLKITYHVFSEQDHVATYNGSAEVEVDCTSAFNAEWANSSGDAIIANYANVAGEIGPPPNTMLAKSAPLAKSASPSTNAVRSAGSASPSGLSFSANGSVLTITDGTHTWKLDAQ